MNHPINRRTFLRASGISLSLPFLESMTRAVSAAAAPANPRRLLVIGTPFGFDPVSFVPTAAGRDYALTPHLQHLKDHRDDFTLITGTSHADTGAAHQTEAVMLTGAPYPDISYNLRNTISLDQEFAARVRGQTRYDSLVLSTGGHTTVPSISCTSNGVPIPPITSPSEIFARLFLGSTPEQASEELYRISEGRSMLDFVGDQAKRLSRRVSTDDRARLDEYFDSVRDVERQLAMSREWVNRPKPAPVGKPPKDIPGPGQQRAKLQLMFDMIHLALVTDSTRSITIRTFGDHHALTHHGQEPEKLAELRHVEVDLLQVFDSLLTKLKSSKEGTGEALLDRTMTLLTSNMRDGNSHKCWDAPAILAGGGFKHGHHLAFNKPWLESLGNPDTTTAVTSTQRPVMGINQAPMSNLFVSLLQRAGIETDHFGTSTGTLTGLEMI
jgi:hypothetical protein